MVRNKAFVLKQNPTGYPVPGQDLVVVVGSFNLREGPPPGGLTVKTVYASLDPYHRACMSETGLLPLMYPLKVGRPLASISIAKVLISLDKRFKNGDMIIGLLAIQEYSIIKPEWTDFYAPIINPHNLELPHFLGVLGITGLTGFGCFSKIGKPLPDETIFVSSAAGGVGHYVGQVAKELGVKVIGSVGTDEKLDFILNDLKFDCGFNYNKEKPGDALRRLAPDGIDVYFDNVGGEHLDAALEAIKLHGRIICCGMISEYNKSVDEKYAYKNLINVATKHLSLRGFAVSDYMKEVCHSYNLMIEFYGSWIHRGLFNSRTYLINGIDNGPEGFVGMLKGKNIGKTVIKIADE